MCAAVGTNRWGVPTLADETNTQTGMVESPQQNHQHRMSGAARRTNAEDVFDALHGEILALRLLPGTRLSEVEVAKRFDVSRQPVREAFIRLANLNLLSIRPQKATVVRKFSHQEVTRARFIRMAVECEVLRRALTARTNRDLARLEKNLGEQERAIAAGDVARFHAQDYEFHRLLCCAADHELMFKTIADYKAHVDRLCILSLTEPTTMDELLADHRTIHAALDARDEPRLLATIRHHLGRLDETIRSIRKSHTDYFED